MSGQPPTSAVRVFAKSLHWLAIGWAVSVGWIWLAGTRQILVRQGTWPSDFGMWTIIAGALSTIAIEVVARWLIRLTGPAPLSSLEQREWRQAFWWSAFPNLMLIGTAYLMTIELW